MEKYDGVSGILGIQMDEIKGVAETFAAINPRKDGYFKGSICFRLEGGKVTEVHEVKIVADCPKPTEG